MRNKLMKAIFCWFTILISLLGTMPVLAEEKTKTVGEAQSFIDGIVAYQLKEAGASSVQQWINNSLTKNAGITSEWYIVGLSQYGTYDFSTYETVLKSYLSENEVYSASSRQKYALALIAAGSTDQYIDTTLQDSIGKQGVMSWVYGLHLLNNGYSSNENSLNSVKETLLSLQLADGGWAVMGTNGDVDVTAMAVQALAPYYNKESEVKVSVDKALKLLSERQLSTGDFPSYGVGNPESTAQVLVALSCLGIDCQNDKRFIKAGNTLFDGIRSYQLSDGSFCHKQGSGYNETATVQVFYSMVAYLRMINNKTSFYILDARNPDGLKVSVSTTVSTEESETTETIEKVESTNRIETTNGRETTKRMENAESNGSSETMEPVEETEGTEHLQTTESLQTTEYSKTTESAQTTGGSQGMEAPKATGNLGVIEGTEVAEGSEITENIETTETIENNEDTEKTNDTATGQDVKKNSSNYKLWVSLAIFLVAGSSCIGLYLMKKRNKKNFILIVAIAVIVIIFVLVTEFQTPESYYNRSSSMKENPIGTVTLTIRCDTIVQKGDSEYIPESGIILDVAEYEIEAGDTVYGILKAATAKHKIHLETTGTAESIYIEGINHIYEFAYGELSGWLYQVNGESPSVGCNAYELKDGDQIAWLYTCEMGKDIR